MKIAAQFAVLLVIIYALYQVQAVSLSANSEVALSKRQINFADWLAAKTKKSTKKVVVDKVDYGFLPKLLGISKTGVKPKTENSGLLSRLIGAVLQLLNGNIEQSTLQTEFTTIFGGQDGLGSKFWEQLIAILTQNRATDMNKCCRSSQPVIEYFNDGSCTLDGISVSGNRILPDGTFIINGRVVTDEMIAKWYGTPKPPPQPVPVYIPVQVPTPQIPASGGNTRTRGDTKVGVGGVAGDGGDINGGTNNGIINSGGGQINMLSTLNGMNFQGVNNAPQASNSLKDLVAEQSNQPSGTSADFILLLQSLFSGDTAIMGKSLFEDY